MPLPGPLAQRAALGQSLHRPDQHKYLDLLKPSLDAVFLKEKVRLFDEMQKLVAENYRLNGSEHGFILDLIPIRSRNAPNLPIRDLGLRDVVPALIEDARRILDLSNKRAADQRRLSQTLSVVLSRCKTTQDVRDVLPDTFVSNIGGLSRLTRTREEGFLLKEDKFLYSQYQRAIEIADYYFANSLIYS